MKYAALITDSIHVEGDERSRTNPGHGYPAHTVDTIRMHEFKDMQDMESWVEKQVTRGGHAPRFKLIQYEELTVKTSIGFVISK